MSIILEIQEVFTRCPYLQNANLGTSVFDQFDPKTLFRDVASPGFFIAGDLQRKDHFDFGINFYQD